MNVLVSSAGRRGALVKIIQQTIESLGGRVFAVDAGNWSAACRLAEQWKQVPRCTDAGFVPAVYQYCRDHNIQLIIPTIDTELPIFAESRQWFAENGISVAVSGPETIKISQDKLTTHDFLIEAGLPTVRKFDVEPNSRLDHLPYPVLIKPRFGSASHGVQTASDAEELHFYLRRTEKPIVQELAQGREFTVNFYVDRGNQCIAAVPHLRLETRGGEVSKCITVRQSALIEIANRLTRTLPDPWGAMCFQGFVDDDGHVKIIEINPRFGGGYPICHQAGADFVQWLVDEMTGRSTLPTDVDWRDGVVMTRWDDAVFTKVEDLKQWAA